MQSDQVLDIVRQAVRVAVMVSLPVLAFGLVVGVITNVFQAVTQISETTLAVVPKFAAMLGALLLFSPWMLDLLMDFTTQIFVNIPTMVR